jgi:hypothetical protein
VSYRGGDPGFVRVIDERTIAFPNYNGNGMYVSMGNLGHNPKVVHGMEPIARSEFVPCEDCVTPVPAWKTGEWVADVPPEADPARDPDRPVA